MSTLSFILYFCICVYVLSKSYYSNNIYDPSGRLIPLENARIATEKHGGPIFASRCEKGIFLLCSKKRRSSKLILRSPKKIHRVSDKILIATSGILTEAEELVNAANKAVLEYQATFSNPIPVQSLCKHIAEIIHNRLVCGRTYAVRLVVAGWDKEKGYQIYTVDNDGSYSGWKTIAVGERSEKIMEECLERLDSSENDNNAGSDEVDDRILHWKLLQYVLHKHYCQPLLENTNNKEADDDVDVDSIGGKDVSKDRVCQSQDIKSDDLEVRGILFYFFIRPIDFPIAIFLILI